LSTSDKWALRRAACGYLAVSILCGIFSVIYEQFSHGVTSAYMVLLFLFPLLGGAAPLLASYLGRQMPAQTTRYLWRCGVATLAVGSCLRGVFEIYGTDAPLAGVYWPVGAVLLGGAVLSGLLTHSFAKSPVPQDVPADQRIKRYGEDF
jgi:hypothetical protein